VKRPGGRCRHRWEDHIKMDLREIGETAWTVDQMCLTQDKEQWQVLVNMGTNFQVP